MNEESTIRIESKITYLEEAVDELNRVVLKQEQSLRDLQALCTQLATKLKALGEPFEEDLPGEERPPHY